MALGPNAPGSAETGPGGRRLRRLHALVPLALWLTIIAVFAVNLLPVQVATSFEQGVAELAAGLGLEFDDSLTVSLVQRLIVYVPLGLLAYAAITLRGGRAAFFGTILVVAAVGLTIELLQSFLSKRQAFSIDFLLVLAVGVLTALAGEIAAGLAAGRRLALLQLLLLGNILAMSAIWLAHRGSDLASWDCDYPLIIGNEATSDRPWLGKLRGLAIYAHALADGEIAALASGFDASSMADRTGLGAALTRSFGEGNELEIARPSRIEAVPDASGLCSAIKKAEAFTIEVEFASLDLDQRGPARILSMSLDPAHRNVTLGQDGRRLSLRIRNELNGENGIEQQIRTAENVISGDWQHWVARYDRGVTTLFLDGDMLKPSLDYESILLVSGRTSLPLAVICGLLSFVLGAAACGWLEGRVELLSGRVIAATALALAPQAILIVVIAMTSHRLLATSVILTIITAATAGVAFGWKLGPFAKLGAAPAGRHRSSPL